MKCGVRGRRSVKPGGIDFGFGSPFTDIDLAETWCGFYLSPDSIRLTTDTESITCELCTQVRETDDR